MSPLDRQDYFSGETLSSLLLDGMQVREKEFYDCIFSASSFRESVWRDCTFSQCRFEACDLTLLSVDGSRFADVRFSACKAAGINWTLASWSRLVREAPLAFEGCVLDYSAFSGLTLHRLQATRCSVREVDFADADLSQADFGHSDLHNSQFRHTTLTRANFEDARKYAIDVTLNRLDGARFSLPEAISLLHSLGIRLREEGA